MCDPQPSEAVSLRAWGSEGVTAVIVSAVLGWTGGIIYDIIKSRGKAINSNNAQSVIIDDALTKAMDLALRFRSNGKPGLKVESVLGQSRLEVTDGVHTVKVDISAEGIRLLIKELQAVWMMAE